MATKVQENEEAPEAQPETQDGPLLDLTDAAVKKMIKVAKKRGYVTYEELNGVLPSEVNSSDTIEDVLGQLARELRLGLQGRMLTLTRAADGSAWSNGRLTVTMDDRFLHIDTAGALLTRHCVRQDGHP